MIEPGYYKRHRSENIYHVHFIAKLVKRPHQAVNKSKYKYLAEARFEFNGANAELYKNRSCSNRQDPNQYMIDPVTNYTEIPFYYYNEYCVVYTLLGKEHLGYFIRSYTNFTSTSPTGVSMFSRIMEPVTL